MIYKKCKYTTCKGDAWKRCKHPKYMQVVARPRGATTSIKKRGPVETFLFLWDVGRATPTSLPELDELETRIKTWILNGCPPPSGSTPPPSPSPDGSTPPPVDDAPRQDGGPRAPKLVGPALDAYKKAVMDKSDDDGTPTHERRLRAYFATLPLASLWNPTHVRSFIAKVHGDVSQNRHRARLMHFGSWVVAEYGLPVPPSPWFDPKSNRVGHKRNTESDGRTRRLHKHEEPALVNAAAAYPDGGLMLGRIYCAIDCGLRRGEMLKLKRGDVLRNFEGTGRTVLRVTWQASKVKKTRYVPVETTRLLAFLTSRAFADFPFGQVDGSRLNAFRKPWVEILIAAGLEQYEWSTRRKTKSGKAYAVRVRVAGSDADLHWHDLRHECGSRLAKRGVDVVEIMRLLGHASLKTTQKYLNTTTAALGASMRKAQRGAITPSPAAVAKIKRAKLAIVRRRTA